ncbi:hypothetical protein RE476_04355 [Methanolobus mangrovi]|uniref:Uncharacterized protein n=1 Tax=Methanolobus mangrovi TaxID=3072977 RepID=A0AA51UGZ2_9EURY|nr:hypothetical protein [Methanolobus mangrovi]WMW23069.1 hypothetical protein RE476_04355 [Methanolobus mangrovi]
MIRKAMILSFALLVLFALTGCASAAVDFPADEAGISAYVQAKPSGINLESAKSAFATIERETSDYVIGTVALDVHDEEEYPHVYVSTDGWVVAYYPSERPSSWILPWADYSGEAITSTTLSKAIGIMATSVGGTSSGIKYYDFRYEDAKNMMIIVESVQGGENFFKFTIPTIFQTYAVDWSHYNIDGYPSNAGYGKSYAYLNGVQVSYLATTDSNYGSFTGQVQNGVEQTVMIQTDNYATGRVGLVLEYAD